MVRARLELLLRRPLILVAAVYLLGVALRYHYTFVVSPPSDHVVSDMAMYVRLARHFLSTPGFPLEPWHVTHPLGFPWLLSLALDQNSYGWAATLQFVFSALVPLAAAALGAAAFGYRTALAMAAVTSLYFPYIEYGALFLSEVHFIFWLALAFAAFLAAFRARTRRRMLAGACAGGVALSIAAVMKAVAIPAAMLFFFVMGLGGLLGPAVPLVRRARARRWGAVALVAALGALPLVARHAQVCTEANRGTFCAMGNKSGADFLLGHYGRVGWIQWGSDEGNSFKFGSPGAYLRRYEELATVPFALNDGAANRAEAWRWIRQNPAHAAVLSLDHVYDAFLGPAAWPTFEGRQWPLAHLFQYLFIVGLLIPTLYVTIRLGRRGWRALLTSRTAIVLSPVMALMITVMIATGEVRYRIPFDLFFMAVVCALAVGDLRRSEPALAPPAG